MQLEKENSATPPIDCRLILVKKSRVLQRIPQEAADSWEPVLKFWRMNAEHEKVAKDQPLAQKMPLAQ